MEIECGLIVDRFMGIVVEKDVFVIFGRKIVDIVDSIYVYDKGIVIVKIVDMVVRFFKGNFQGNGRIVIYGIYSQEIFCVFLFF